MAWFYLALLATILYAVVTLLDDNLLAFVYKSPYLSCVSVGFFGSLPLLSRFFLHANVIPPNLALLSTAAGFLTLAYYFFYFRGLQTDSPSVVVALFSLVPATLPFLAYFIVGERLTGVELVGFLIILLASLGLAVQDVRLFKFSKALIFVAVGALMLDVVTLLTKYVYERVDFYPAYLYFSIGMALGGIFFFFLKRRANTVTILEIAHKVKKLLPLFIIAETAGLAAEFTINMALSRGAASLVKVIEGSQPIFVLLISLLLYPLAPKHFREAREGNLLRKFALIGVIIAGLVVISVGAGAFA